MTDLLQEQETEQTDAQESTSTATEQAKTEKTFTQKQVNDLVQQRLSRAEGGWQKERAAWETERAELTASVTSLQETVDKAVFSVLTSRMSTSEQKMFSAMPFDKKLEFIQDESNLAALNQKTKVPETPKSTEKPKSQFKRNQSI